MSGRWLHALTAALVAGMVALATCSGPPELERDPYALPPGTSPVVSGAR